MIIKLDKFEGPFYLLLSLIENEELSITEVSLVKVADQYVEYLKNNRDIDPEQIADFLVVAAKLLLLKSRALLPFLYPQEDEEVDDFEKQIKMYQEFLVATKQIAEMIGNKKLMFAREFNRKAFLNEQNFFAPPKNITTEGLAMVFEDILSRLKPAEKMEESSVEDEMSIEEKIVGIREILNKKINFVFRDFIKQAKNKTEIIVGFLAILELMKQRELLLDQTELFGEIQVSRPLNGATIEI